MAFIAGGLFATSVAYAESTEGTMTPTTHHIAKRMKSAKGVVPQEKDVVDPVTSADNTGINKRDRAGTEATADQQKNNKSDVAVTAEIRRAIMKDKTLSTNAHNVKIIVKNGNVTLKGPVGSQTECTAVEKAALDAIGPGKGTITNEVSVAP
jgi:osmotically-inducible protein OsmY